MSDIRRTNPVIRLGLASEEGDACAQIASNSLRHLSGRGAACQFYAPSWRLATCPRGRLMDLTDVNKSWEGLLAEREPPLEKAAQMLAHATSRVPIARNRGVQPDSRTDWAAAPIEARVRSKSK